MPWLLDPDNEYVRSVLATYEDRQPDDPCDPMALAADIDDSIVLIMQRHIGIAEGEFAGQKMIKNLTDCAAFSATTTARSGVKIPSV